MYLKWSLLIVYDIWKTERIELTAWCHTIIDTCSSGVWWFPEIGVFPVIIHFCLGFSIVNHPEMG
jgi:hypothetical protein